MIMKLIFLRARIIIARATLCKHTISLPSLSSSKYNSSDHGISNSSQQIQKYRHRYITQQQYYRTSNKVQNIILFRNEFLLIKVNDYFSCNF